MASSICQVCGISTVTWGCGHGRWCPDHLQPHLEVNVSCRDQFTACMGEVMERMTAAFRSAFAATYSDGMTDNQVEETA